MSEKDLKTSPVQETVSALKSVYDRQTLQKLSALKNEFQPYFSSVCSKIQECIDVEMICEEDPIVMEERLFDELFQKEPKAANIRKTYNGLLAQAERAEKPIKEKFIEKCGTEEQFEKLKYEVFKCDFKPL